MNGVTAPEQDYSEFVEVDPTGRYGRVSCCSHFLSLFFSPLCSFVFIQNFGSCFLTSSLLKFAAFCSTMKFLAKELQKQCMVQYPFQISAQV